MIPTPPPPTPAELQELRREVELDGPSAWDLPGKRDALLSACERLARVDRFLEEHGDTVEEYLGYSSSGPVNDALKAFRALRTEKR